MLLLLVLMASIVNCSPLPSDGGSHKSQVRHPTSIDSSQQQSSLKDAVTSDLLNSSSSTEDEQSNVKVTHQVSHVEFQVSEVGPGASTIPAPTLAMKPTHPIPTALSRPKKKDPSDMSPVFVPRINLDGSPLPPKSTFLSDDVTGRILKKKPNISSNSSKDTKPKVISSYSSMSIGATDTLENLSISGGKHQLINPSNEALAEEVDFSQIDFQNPTTERIYNITSLLPSTFKDVSTVTSATTLTSLEEVLQEAESFVSKTTDDLTTPTEDAILIVESSRPPSKSAVVDDILFDHDKTFKREAVDKSLNVLKDKDTISLFQDYEKEDVSVFADDVSIRDPRIYVNSKEETEKKEITKSHKDLKLKEKDMTDEEMTSDITFTKIDVSNAIKKNITYVEKPIIIAKIFSNIPNIEEEGDIIIEMPEPIVTTETSTPIPELEDILEKDEIIAPFIIKPEDIIPKLEESGIRIPEIVEEEIQSKELREDDVSSEYVGELPTAAAVAEADILTDFNNIAPRESSALDSSLTADKHVLESNYSPSSSSPLSPGGQELPIVSNGVSAARASDFSIGYVTAIICGSVIAVLLVVGMVLFLLHQHRVFNRPKHLGSDRGYAGSDSGGYLDDQCQSSYTNSHLDIPKGCPDDLISLDNDSFLNSLESMTIQNLWTDNIKHTKL